MLNWKLIAHPVNWVIIVLMVIIGVMVLNLLLTPWHSGTGGVAVPMPDDQQ